MTKIKKCEKCGDLTIPIYSRRLCKCEVKKSSDILKDLKPYPHETEQGYCCACDYDISYFESKLEEQKQEMVKVIKPLEEAVKMVRLDVEVMICDCGEKYKDSDLDLSVGEVEKCLDTVLSIIKK